MKLNQLDVAWYFVFLFIVEQAFQDGLEMPGHEISCSYGGWLADNYHYPWILICAVECV